MSQTYDFQVAQADAAAIEAGEATLENARLRALRSEAAWREMADRTLRMQKGARESSSGAGTPKFRDAGAGKKGSPVIHGHVLVISGKLP